MTVGHSPSLGRSVFLAAQPRRDMFANKADTLFSPAPRIPERPTGGNDCVLYQTALCRDVELLTVFMYTAMAP